MKDNSEPLTMQEFYEVAAELKIPGRILFCSIVLIVSLVGGTPEQTQDSPTVTSVESDSALR
jgi:hypothetical protein